MSHSLRCSTTSWSRTRPSTPYSPASSVKPLAISLPGKLNRYGENALIRTYMWETTFLLFYLQMNKILNITIFQVITFLKKKEGFIDLVLKHIDASAMMDLLLRLISCVEPAPLRQEVLHVRYQNITYLSWLKTWPFTSVFEFYFCMFCFSG